MDAKTVHNWKSSRVFAGIRINGNDRSCISSASSYHCIIQAWHYKKCRQPNALIMRLLSSAYSPIVLQNQKNEVWIQKLSVYSTLVFTTCHQTAHIQNWIVIDFAGRLIVNGQTRYYQALKSAGYPWLLQAQILHASFLTLDTKRSSCLAKNSSYIQPDTTLDVHSWQCLCMSCHDPGLSLATWLQCFGISCSM